MNSDNLGLSEQDLQTVQTQIQFVIHSAASIELEADVQHTLRSNYLGTQRLLALAARMNALKCFVHVSTAYVNVNLPRGSYIEERLYPLYIGEQEVHHADIVEDLMSLKPFSANVRAQMYLDMWDFPNTYTLGKNLTEKLVASYHKQYSLPIAIVRPTLVCGLAGDPYPGYCGNLAGPVGMGVAMAIGLFDRLESVAMVPTHVWDAVPGDVVSSVILATAAATAAKVDFNQYRNSKIGSSEDPPVVHAGTSTTYPISMAEAFYAGFDFVKQNPPPFRLPGSKLFTIPLDYRPDEAAVKRRKFWTSWKVWIAVKLLERLGQHKTARRLKYGHMAWEIQNSAKTDRNVFFASKNLKQLEALLDAADSGSAHYKVTWTIRNGGWPRYISTNIAGMYRIVFGMSDVKGLEDNDFKFIPSRSRVLAPAKDPSGAPENDTVAESDTRKTLESADNHGSAPLMQTVSEGDEGNVDDDDDASSGQEDVITQGLKGTAAAFSTIVATGADFMNELTPDAAAGYRDQQVDSSGVIQSLSMKLAHSLTRPHSESEFVAGSHRSSPVRQMRRLTSFPAGRKDA
eukprot:GHUV01005923.1.p1 GENE.GHUV01005923.1~~GHUV01005923.1.p1  ORF type:complete len:571 (+),score=168.70 GHUV01005923.1:688-2400(+)